MAVGRGGGGRGGRGGAPLTPSAAWALWDSSELPLPLHAYTPPSSAFALLESPELPCPLLASHGQAPGHFTHYAAGKPHVCSRWPAAYP